MCDSFVALGNSTLDGSVLLAKSADTEINEAEHVVRVAAGDYGEGAMVRIGHLNIPQARHTHEIILGKSFWAWGAELGANEHGVAVGNEAAFSNQISEKDGACCLDLLRLTVERAATAKEGVEVIAHHVETFGQGGNCQMMGNYAFDSGLLVADASEAYVINCAGRDWAVRQVEDVMAISNRYQIGADWDSSSLAPEKDAKPDFRARFADEKLERACGAVARESAALERLQARKGSITVADMAAILRHVGDDEENYDICYSGVADKVCMHAAPEEDRWWQATGAMVTDSSADGIVVWMTGTSCTDLSIFKPLFFGMPTPDVGPPPLGTYTEGALWWRHERLHRRAMADYATLKPEIRADFDDLENQFFAEGPGLKKSTKAVQAEFAEACWRRAEEATSAWIERLEKRNYFVPNTAYRKMWDRFNREASMPI